VRKTALSRDRGADHRVWPFDVLLSRLPKVSAPPAATGQRRLLTRQSAAPISRATLFSGAKMGVIAFFALFLVGAIARNACGR
jgi:hypothetical protein